MSTYYTNTAGQGGPLGANGKKLVAFKSVAVRLADYPKLKGKKVEIKGVGVLTVDDSCAGSGCKDFDVFMGDDAQLVARLPQWKKEGIVKVEYRWV